jgi:hypothetical protein
MLKLEGIDNQAGVCSDDELDNSFNELCSEESEDDEAGYDDEEDMDTVDRQLEMDDSEDEDDDWPESSSKKVKKRVCHKKRSVLEKK